MKLNLGCGHKILDGWVNVDKYDTFSPDVIWDLETFPWPFEDNSVEEILLSHVMEHLGSTSNIFLKIMQELYRICKNKAEIDIIVPHPWHDIFMGDPTHIRPIMPYMFELFDLDKNIEWKEKGWNNSTLALDLDVNFKLLGSVYIPDQLYKELPIDEFNILLRQRNNVCIEIKMGLGVIKDK